MCTVLKKPPWQIPDISFCKELTLIKKSSVPDYYLRNLFIEHFALHEGSVPIYTDGSKSEDGVGFAVIFPELCVKRRLPDVCSIFTAELSAILLALQYTYTFNDTSYIIVSDSQSALAAIEKYNPFHPVVQEIQEWLYILYSSGKTVAFCWVPSHIGIHMNDLADSKAKAAVTNRNISHRRVPSIDYYPIIESKLKSKWNEIWVNTSLSNKLRTIKSNVSIWESSYHKQRQWEVVLARLRLGHTRLTHKFLMEKTDAPICRDCRVRLTVQHFLIDCPKYVEQRNIFLKIPRSESLSLKSVLAESEFFNIENIMKFLAEIGILNDI